MMLSREKSVLTLIYARRRSEKQVLLGRKKRGFGEGKLNGFGGKLEPGETIEESAARELLEESGLRAAPADFIWCGTLTYIYDTKPKAMEVNVFELDRWEGEPVETEEMEPAWFAHAEIPLPKMWADDEHWLLQYLDGSLARPFTGRFRFKGHEGQDSSVIIEKHVSTLAAPPTCLANDVPQLGAALVVSTVSFAHAPQGSARPLESFIRYHLAKGFARILIVVDHDSDIATLSVLRKFPQARVQCRVRGPALLNEQRQRCSSFAELSSMLDTEVSARQMLDAELAMALAPEMGCSWVVCLDSDELFFTAETSVVPHFEGLAAEGVDQMTYLNHEGVPEVSETPDYFASITLFKRHHFEVPITADARTGLRFWMDRSARGQYLLFYDNGKSACRSGVNARPRSQHLWRLPDGRRSCTALADPRRMDIEGYRSCADPCVLHFPVCGLEWFQAKYRTLGNFPDSWLGGKVKIPESFHRDAREAGAAGGDALELLFRHEVLLDDTDEIARQIACKTCIRRPSAAVLLDSISIADPGIAKEPLKPQTSKPQTVATAPLDAGMQGIERGWILSKSMGYL